MTFLPEWESFSLTYTVMPSFQVAYGVRLEYQHGQLQLWTRNAPDTDLFHGREEDFPSIDSPPLFHEVR
mgnify:CR=1 FL=1